MPVSITGVIHTSLRGQFPICSFFTSIKMVEFMLNPQVSKNFRLCTQQQSLKIVQATVTKADELVKIKFTDRKC